MVTVGVLGRFEFKADDEDAAELFVRPPSFELVDILQARQRD